MVDILFISPPYPKPMFWSVLKVFEAEPLLGVGYVAAVLQKNGFSTEMVNYYAGIKDTRCLKKQIQSKKPKIVGLTCTTDLYENARLLARIIKSINPEIVIVIGGPHVTFAADETLLDRNIDIVVRGEGEYTMLELAKVFITAEGSLEKIKGISYRSNPSGVQRNPSRPFIKDLDELPYPVRDYSQSINQRTAAGVASSRGCPHGCIFCAATAMSGGRYRMRNPEAVFEEVMHLKSMIKNLDTIVFLDDTVTVDVERLSKISRYMKKANVRWAAESRVDVIEEDPKVFDWMAKNGCIGLQFGVESGSQEILDKIRKGTNLGQIERAVKLSTKAGIQVFCSMMIGQAEDTYETVKQTVAFATHLQCKYKVGVLCSITTPYPGTFMFNHPESLGIRIQWKDYNDFHMMNPIFEGKYLTIRERRALFFDATQELLRNMPEPWKEMWRTILTRTD